MAKAKANVQWAPGTRLSRFNKEDGQYEHEMELIRNKTEVDEFPPKPQPFEQGEMVWKDGEITFLGKVDPKGYWVEWRNAKVSVDCFKKIPEWFEEAYTQLDIEMNGVIRVVPNGTL